MKKRRNNLIFYVITFICGGLVFGTIGVYAATTLASSSVSYDNATSGSASSNVQGAVDELYSNASAGKTNIINSLNTKGLTLGSNSSYADIVSGINSLSVGNFEGMLKLLWTNPSPNTAQPNTPYTIDVNITGYRYLLFEIKRSYSDSNTNESYIARQIFDMQKNSTAINLNYSDVNTGYNRRFNNITNTSMNCYTAYSSAVAVPIRIYGFN